MAGGKTQLVSTLAPERTFKLRVKEWVEPARLVWGDAMGTPVYALSPTNTGNKFSMPEKM